MKAGDCMRGESNTYLTGTLAGGGSFRCRECGFAVALNALEEVPKCPHCGNSRFARASLFDTHGLEQPPEPELGEDDSWIDVVRQDLDESGHYLVYRDDDRVSVLPLLGDWIRIGRSLTADIRFDDPTVSRRHAIVARQGGRIRVLDDRSLNGIFLNGLRVEWGDLEDGAEIVIGRYRLHFLDTAGSTASAHAETAAA